MRLHAYAPYEPMPTIRFSYNVTGVLDCEKERAGRIGIVPPIGGTPVLPAVLYPVSSGNFQEADVFLVSTCDAKDLLLSTNNASSRIKFLTTASATPGTQSERMTILNNGNVGIGNASPVNHFQLNEIFGFHAGGSSVIAHNAYWTGSVWKTIVEASTATTPTKDLYPSAISLWNGSIGLEIGNSRPSTITANSTITWKTALQVGYTGNVGIGAEWVNSRLYIKGEDHSSSHSALNVTDDTDASLLFVRNDGVVKVGTLAGTGNRPVYANASGELIDAGSVGSAGSWTLGGNAISTNSYFIGTKDNYPLVFKTNDTERMKIKDNGKVIIGTGTTITSGNHTDYLLAVYGKIIGTELIVTLDGWSDFVFKEDYPLLPLEEVEKYINTERRLPGIPSEEDVKQNGVSVGNMQAKLLQKIEELTLYMIEIKKENKELQTKLTTLQQQVNERK
jgi:hypothetical protein